VAKQQETDFNSDRYPDVYNVLRRILQNEPFPKGPIERLEVTTLANGEANWRVTPARAEVTEGGHLPPID
jgi:hypothetical protein